MAQLGHQRHDNVLAEGTKTSRSRRAGRLRGEALGHRGRKGAGHSCAVPRVALWCGLSGTIRRALSTCKRPESDCGAPPVSATGLTGLSLLCFPSLEASGLGGEGFSFSHGCHCAVYKEVSSQGRGTVPVHGQEHWPAHSACARINFAGLKEKGGNDCKGS